VQTTFSEAFTERNMLLCSLLFLRILQKGDVDVQSTFLEAFTERDMLMCNLFLWRLLQKRIC